MNTDHVHGGTFLGRLGSPAIASSRSPVGDLAVPVDDLLRTHPAMARDTSPIATEIGPFNTGDISFPGGVPVGGWAGLSLSSDGSFSFSGLFHDSGLPSYDSALAWAIADTVGNGYLFARSGHLAGTLEPGSREFRWNNTGVNPTLRAGFEELTRGCTGYWVAGLDESEGALAGHAFDGIRAAGYRVNVVTPVVF